MTTIFFCTVHFISQSTIALRSVELVFYASRSMIPFGRLFRGFPALNKGVFQTTGDLTGFFWGEYGYPMDTLNSQTHFKIGNSSL